MTYDMKNSNIEWVGQIPEYWSKDKVIRLFKVIGSGTTPKSSDDSNFDGIINWIQSGDLNGGFLTSTKNKLSQQVLERYSALKLYMPPFLVVAMYGASIGNLAISNIEGCVNQACCVLQNPICDLKYTFYVFKAAKDYLVQKAVGGGQSNISQDTIKSLWIPQPPIQVQHRIAAYLDTQCAHIDAVIEKTKASIEEYKKLKQSIITQAVAKGVHGERPMVDHDNPWFSSLPVGIKTSRVGLHYNIILGKMICSDKKSDDMVEYPYYCAANVHFDGVDNSSLKKMWFTQSEIEQYSVQIGDLLVVEGGAGAGGCAIVQQIDETTGVQNSIQIVRSKNGHDVRYLCYMIQALVKQQYIDVVCNKATIPHFTKDKLGTMPYPVWPIKDQAAIADYLDEECIKIDLLIEKKNQFLAELENYKKSLIYEYVTGKKEVPVDAS